jgi:HlyD family secretion protein
MADAKQSKFDSRLLWIPALLLIILIFFSVRHWTRQSLPVRVARAERQSLTKTRSTNGKVEPQKNFEAPAPAPGTIKALYVHAGELVKPGQLLLSMADDDAKSRAASALANLRGAQANLDAMTQGGTQEEQLSLTDNLSKAQAEAADAQRNLYTLKKLQAQGAASPSEVASAQQRLDASQVTLQGLDNRRTKRYAAADLTHARASLAEAQAAYAAAQAVVDQSNVRAPFAGTVYSLPVSQTEFVQQGQDLLQMADLTKLQVRAYFDEPDIGELQIGQVAKIVWDAKHGESWTGHVARLPSTIITYGTRNVGETLISIDSPDATLLPNVNVTVTVTTQHLDNVLTIPREALHTEAGSDYVYIVSGDALHRKKLTIGSITLTQVQVLSGLAEGDTVALGTTNGDPIAEGVPIRIVQ